jgi:glycosyltransferase involved in cell wall biosynthesis
MNALDLHVTSSVTEGFPNVITEALACGTMCVSTDVGDAGFVLGLSSNLVPVARPEELGVAMINALEMRGRIAEWEQLRQSARDRCETRFSLARMVADYQRLWAKVATVQMLRTNLRRPKEF